MGTYSKAPEAAKKKAIDAKIGGKIKIDMNDEGYLKALIAAGVGDSISANAKGLQFFIIRGGGEGFLDASYADKDASQMTEFGDTTSASEILMKFDDNDLLAVFDNNGSLISSALLSRPIFVAPDPSTPHSGLRESTANQTYDAWDGRSVSLYRNENFDVKYYGLWVDDSLGWYRKGRVRIDLHKEEGTNGCIFIKESNPSIKTPSTDLKHRLLLNAFEPTLIRAIKVSAQTRKPTSGPCT